MLSIGLTLQIGKVQHQPTRASGLQVHCIWMMDDSNVLQGTLPVQVTDDSGLVRSIQPDVGEGTVGLSLDCKATPRHSMDLESEQTKRFHALYIHANTVHDPRLG